MFLEVEVLSTIRPGGTSPESEDFSGSLFNLRSEQLVSDKK